jgi:signal transduction histidine kinase
VLPLYFDRLLNQGDVTEVLPALEFREYSALGHVNSYLDKDGTLRSIRLMDRFEEQRWPHFSFASYLFNHPNSPLLELKLDDVFIPFVTKGDFKRVSFVDVLTGLVPSEKIRQRNVFVGVTATSVGDPLLIPTRDGGRQTPAVVINANVYQALDNNQLISPLTHFLAFVLNSLFVLLALYLMPKLSGLQQFLVTVIFMLAAWLLSYGLLFQGYWYRSAGVLLALLMLPFIWNLLRLSRLFNYLRQQIKQLKQQQAEEVFHLPSYHGLSTEDDLKVFLSMVQIENFSLADIDEEERGLVELKRDNSVTKQFLLKLNGKSKRLVVGFKEFTALEKHKLNILEQLLFQKQRDEKDAGNRSQVETDVFAQQLSLLNDFQQQISITQTLFEESIDGVSAGILVTDLIGKVLFSNRALKELIGVDVNDAKHLFGTVLLQSGEGVGLIRDAILLQETITVEAKAGPRDLSISIRCIQNEVDVYDAPLAPLVVFNITDISSIKQAHRSRSEMIDFLSHDLRSPMASLQAMVNQLRLAKRDEPALASVDVEDLIEKVDMYSRRGLNFAEQFLELAKVEGNEDIELYELDLYSIAQNAFDTLYHQAQEKGIKLELNIAGDYWVETNGELIERIILNLVSNAIKYGPSDSQVVLDVCELSESLLQLSISDQGPGIPSDLSERLFQPYTRGKDSNTQKAQGIGLGLRFVDVALKRLNSQIQFESSQQGTRFYFNLESLDMEM